jgi:hypothetical protein
MREASLCYMDNVNLPSDDEKDIIMADEVCRAFETFNTILNRNAQQLFLAWGGGGIVVLSL